MKKRKGGVSKRRRLIGVVLALVLWGIAAPGLPYTIASARLCHIVWSRQRSKRPQSFPKAMRTYMHFIKAYPDDARGYYFYARFLERYPRFWGAAERFFRDALRLNPRMALAHDYLAQIYAHTGRDWEAIEEYHEAMGVDPENPIYPWHLGSQYATCWPMLHEKLGWTRAKAFRKALGAFKRARELAPKDFVYARSVASLFTQAKHIKIAHDPHEAIGEWKYCLTTNATDFQKAVVYRKLGLVYFHQLHDVGSARDMWLESLRLHWTRVVEELLKSIEQPRFLGKPKSKSKPALRSNEMVWCRHSKP